MPKIRSKVMHNSWLRQRELGCRLPLGHNDRLSKELYSSIVPCTFWDHSANLKNALHGGVFNLEFSPDSSLLVAACEKKSILMFDPLCRKLIHAVDNAHRDCVNCVRFLDSRVFATCSDDSTVALWDARNLKSQIRTLHGHSNWVKNIEFSPRDGLLVTSGFDGSIYTWDINSYTENGFLYKRVFHTNGLMRTRLNPDASKMVICTTGGYLMVVHDLDLNTLAQDLYGFKPNMYRLMQLSQTTIPVATNFTHLFSKKRKVNRVEIVADFPKGDEAEVVSSLQIHPQGWCALSRNISNDETSEWTCVHDIQDISDAEIEEEEQENEDEGRQKRSQDSDSDSEPESEQRNDGDTVSLSLLNPVGITAQVRRRRTEGSASDSREPPGLVRRETERLLSRAVSLNTGPGLSATSVELHVSSPDVWEALVAVREARVRQEREREHNEREEREATGNTLTRISVRDAFVRRRELRHLAEQVNREVENGGSGHPPGEQTVAPRAARFRILVHRGEQELEGNSTAYAIFNRPHGGDIAQVPFNISSGNRPPGSGNTLSNPARLIRPNENNNSSAVLVVNHRPRSSSSSPGGSSNVNRQIGSTIYRVRTGSLKPDGSTKRNRLIHQNLQRLTHFIEEPNLGKGFIKELCFSADGRLICSPYGYGVRLLAFSPDCAELSSCVPAEPPVQLHELGTNVCHTDIVVSTKFSPQHCLLVSGCLTGKIVWHQPVV